MKGVRLTHIGGPTVLIEAAGWTIITDPTFDPPGETYHFGWGTSSRKVTGPAVAIGDLPQIDVALLTHDHHADNLDGAGRALLPSVGTVITTASGATRLGGETRGLDPWQSTQLVASGRPTIDVTATPCRHGPPLTHALIGDVIGFALKWDGQEHGVLWISGDTVLYDGVRQVAERLQVDIAILHLGAARFGITGPIQYTMGAKSGIDLCRAVKPRTAIPVHYEGWSHFRQGRDVIERELANAPDDISQRFHLLPIGTAVDVPA